MRINDKMIETASKNKQFNVLLWFVVLVVIAVVSFVLYKCFVFEQKVEDTLSDAVDHIDHVMDSHEVSLTQILELREDIVKEYVTFSDRETRVIDSLSQDGMLWGKNYLIQSAISCVEIGFNLDEMQIEPSDGKLIVNLGKPKILNTIPNGSSKPLIVRFEGYLKSEGDWSAADKMKLQEKVNDKMIRNCSDWNYYQKASDKALSQIKMLIQHKLDAWNLKDVNIEIVIEQ